MQASTAAVSQTGNRAGKHSPLWISESYSKALCLSYSKCHRIICLSKTRLSFFDTRMTEPVLLFVCYFMLVFVGPGGLC